MFTATNESFPVLRSTPTDPFLTAFLVSTARGFLPHTDPITVLPSTFKQLEHLLQRMPIKTANGSAGLLATGSLGDAVKYLPDLTEQIEVVKADLPLMNALAGFKPFMEYAGSYALYNYRLADPAKGLEYSNLRLIRAFEHGLDPSSSETGFVLVHVDMVQNSGPLVAGATAALAAVTSNSRPVFEQSIETIVTALTKVNRVMNTMWNKSKPGDYNSFRTFIFGITSQSMFPDGVVYEGVSDEPMSFRGESGANDSMIPLMDNLLAIPMPSTPLTDILTDFRSYRPGNHREFLEWVQARSTAVDLRGYATQAPSSAALYLKALDQVRDFRWRHWCFTREYILKKTAHPVATGGSPIVTWLPNQLQAVLDLMIKVAGRFETLPGCEDIMDLVVLQQGTLRKEVRKYCEERKV
ncbi:hypothetical protein MMC15_002097 [Xylographa vitiligo]|nr:hypothetical protein [Xylographa vitiligo]